MLKINPLKNDLELYVVTRLKEFALFYQKGDGKQCGEVRTFFLSRTDVI